MVFVIRQLLIDSQEKKSILRRAKLPLNYVLQKRVQARQSCEDTPVCHSPEATVTLVPIWKRDISKRGISKSLVSHVLNFKSWIKLIYDKITYIYGVINEFNPIFEVQNMGNEVF